MSLTQEEIIQSGYRLKAAPVDSWQNYDENNPVPAYFDFDWLSSRHPDLYHRFALSTVGLMSRLHTLIDLTGQVVIDVGAGTGRSATEAAKKARWVYAVDLYTSVVSYGKHQLQPANTSNVQYIQGDRDKLPFCDDSMDVLINSWAELNYLEAYRVLRPNGFLIQLGSIPTALCGELTSLLAPDYSFMPTETAPAEVYNPQYPDMHRTADHSNWEGIPVSGPIHIHEFTYVADYGDFTEAAAITGRLYGPKAKQYFLAKKQSTFAWRLQIIMGQVSKPA